jgi:hypothetical protein
LRGFSRFGRSRSLLLLLAVLVFSVRVVIAQSTLPITITPAPPPGVSEAVSRILSWIMWAGWIVVAGAFIVGAIHFAMGDSEKGKKYVTGAIIGAIIMAFYTAIITGLVG